jgi:hypothetical protein
MLVMNAIISHHNKTAGNVGPRHNVTLPTHTRCEGDNLSFIFTAELAHCVAPCCFVVRLFFFSCWQRSPSRRRRGTHSRYEAEKQTKKTETSKAAGKSGAVGCRTRPVNHSPLADRPPLSAAGSASHFNVFLRDII